MSVAPKTIVLVGATSGLGRHAARQFTGAGHRLIAVGRDPTRAAKLARSLPGVHIITADVSTLDGVDRVARQVHAATDHVDVLVNNAGVMLPTRQTTPDGMELNFAVHHLAPYSLTSRLLPLLRPAGRVINVNSEGHRAPLRGGGPVHLDFGDLQGEKDYDPFMAYSRSKLANLLFTYELQRRHSELTVAAVHPGMVRTDLGREFPRIQVALLHALALSASQGARPVVRLATDPEIQPGAYYNRYAPVPSSTASHDLHTARRLWTATEQLRGLFGSTAATT